MRIGPRTARTRRSARGARLTLAAAWVSVLTIPLASAPLFGQSSFLTLPNVFGLAAMGSAVVRPRTLRAYRGGVVAVLAFLVAWVLVVGLVLGPDAWPSVVTTYGAIIFFFVGALLPYSCGENTWHYAVLGGACISAAVGLLHYRGIVPIFGFEQPPVAARTIGGFQFSQPGYKGLITSSADYDMWLLGGLMAASQWLVEWRSSRSLSGRTIRPLFALVAIPLLILAVVVSQSRAGWLMVVVFVPLVGVAYWASQERRAHQRVVAVLSLFAAFLVGVGGWAVFGSGERIAQDVVAAAPVTVSIRMAQYPLAVGQIAAHPIIGVGHSVLFSYEGYEDVAHNTFLNFGINFGIPAMVALGVVCLLVLVRVVRLALTAPTVSERRIFGVYAAAIVALAIPVGAASGLGSKTFFGLLGLVYGATVRDGFAGGRMRSASSRRLGGRLGRQLRRDAGTTASADIDREMRKAKRLGSAASCASARGGYENN